MAAHCGGCALMAESEDLVRVVPSWPALRAQLIEQWWRNRHDVELSHNRAAGRRYREGVVGLGWAWGGPGHLISGDSLAFAPAPVICLRIWGSGLTSSWNPRFNGGWTLCRFPH